MSSPVRARACTGSSRSEGVRKGDTDVISNTSSQPAHADHVAATPRRSPCRGRSRGLVGAPDDDRAAAVRPRCDRASSDSTAKAAACSRSCCGSSCCWSRVCSRSWLFRTQLAAGGLSGDGAGAAAAHVARVRQLRRAAAVDPLAAALAVRVLFTHATLWLSLQFGVAPVDRLSHESCVVRPLTRSRVHQQRSMACSEQGMRLMASSEFAAISARRARPRVAADPHTLALVGSDTTRRRDGSAVEPVQRTRRAPTLRPTSRQRSRRRSTFTFPADKRCGAVHYDEPGQPAAERFGCRHHRTRSTTPRVASTSPARRAGRGASDPGQPRVLGVREGRGLVGSVLRLRAQAVT